MYYSLFLDESGKSHQQEFTALCGYIASIDEWARFDFEWKNRLLKWGIPAIHMSRVMANDIEDKDEWSKLRKLRGNGWSEWRDHVLSEFAGFVANSNIACVGGVVDASAYRKIAREEPEDFLLANADSNVFLLQNALMFALDKVDLIDKGGYVTINIDDDREHAIEYYNAYWNLKTLLDNPCLPEEMRFRFARITDRVDMIAFCNDRYHPAIQAADMIAYVSRRYKVNESKGADDSASDLYSLLTRGGVHQPKWYSEETLYKLAGNTARSMRKIRDEENCLGL